MSHHHRIRRAIAGAALIALAAIGLAACSSQTAPATASSAASRSTLRIATSEDRKYQDVIKEIAAAKGLDVEWVQLDDWVLPNTQVVDGTVDGNAFQHILFLSQFNTKNNAQLTPVFSTLISQWGIFSASHKAVSEFPDGGRIAIPDDPSNRGRALFILQSAGLITLRDGVGNFPTPEDIAANPHGFAFVEIKATTIPQQFADPSLAGVVVGTAYFDPKQNITSASALYLDDSLSTHNLPYGNIVATTQAKKDDPGWKLLDEVYGDPRVAEAITSESGGALERVKVPVDTLRAKLAELEKEAAATS